MTRDTFDMVGRFYQEWRMEDGRFVLYFENSVRSNR